MVPQVQNVFMVIGRNRNHGHRKLGELLHSMELFEMEEQPVGEGQSKALYIRDKRK